MLINNIYLEQTSIQEIDTLNLLFKAATEDRCNKYIWNIHENSMSWEDIACFESYLRQDFGTHYIYVAYLGKLKLGIFGMLNVKHCVGCANVLVWIDYTIRHKTALIKWWLLFVLEAQNKKISHLYAKIRLSNAISIKTSMHCGFIKCDSIPEYSIMSNINDRDVCYVTRNTQFSYFEKKYIVRYIGP